MAEFFQPGLGQAGIRPVFELDIAFALGPGLPYLLNGYLHIVVFHSQVQIEPVAVFLILLHIGHHLGIGVAHFVPAQILFPVYPVGLDQFWIGVQEELDGFFRLQEPHGIASGLKIHILKQGNELFFFLLLAAQEKGFAFKLVASGLQLRVWTVKGDFPVFSLVHILNFQS